MNKNSTEYRNGFDAGKNGSNTTNTHFSFFSTKEQTSDWEAGKRDGEQAKGKKKSKPNPRKK